MAARQFLSPNCLAITLTAGVILKKEQMPSLVGERPFWRHFRRHFGRGYLRVKDCRETVGSQFLLRDIKIQGVSQGPLGSGPKWSGPFSERIPSKFRANSEFRANSGQASQKPLFPCHCFCNESPWLADNNPDPPTLAFSERSKGNPEKKQGFFSSRSPSIPWKRRKNAERARKI